MGYKNLKKSLNIAFFGNIHKSVTLIRVVPFSNYEIAVSSNYSDFLVPQMGCTFVKKVCTFDKKVNIAVFSNCSKINIA